MNSDKVIYVLIAFNSLLVIMCIHEKNWHKAVYWFGALTINSSILWGMK
jgi:hypothetical protein